jgi:predicted Zn-dependent protease
MGHRSYPLHAAVPLLVLLSAVFGCGESQAPPEAGGSSETLRALESIERLLDAGRVTEALRAAEACARARPDDALSAEMLGRARMAAQAPRPDIADAYARAADLRPDSPGLQSAAGITAMQAGRVEAAIARLTRAAELEPGNAQHPLQRSLALRAAGRWEDARSAAERAVSLAPLEPSAHLALAQALLGAGQPSEAATATRAALACKPSDRALRFEVGNTLVACGQAAAASEIVIVQAREPTASPSEIETLARALEAAQRHELAAEQWERLAMDPTRPWRPCLQAARCHAQAGARARAQEWIARARERGAPPAEIDRVQSGER